MKQIFTIDLLDIADINYCSCEVGNNRLKTNPKPAIFGTGKYMLLQIYYMQKKRLWQIYVMYLYKKIMYQTEPKKCEYT